MDEIIVFIRPEVQNAPGFLYSERARPNGHEEEVETVYQFRGHVLHRENGHFLYRMKTEGGVLPVELARFADTAKTPVSSPSVS